MQENNHNIETIERPVEFKIPMRFKMTNTEELVVKNSKKIIKV